MVVLGCAYLLFVSLPTRSLSLNTVSKLLPLIRTSTTIPE